MSNNYEKQLRWRQATLKKAAQQKAESNEDQNCTFTPVLATFTPAKPLDGPVREIVEKTSLLHVDRLIKARREKAEQQDKAMWKPSAKNQQTAKLNMTISLNHQSKDNEGSPILYPQKFSDGENENRDRGYRSYSPRDYQGENYDTDVTNIDEPIVELLERERREWHTERVKLLHCIHLQQLELNKRSIAAHERAADIAKEFAGAIEGFEERLVSVENSIQKEIMSIKSIAESLKASAQILQTQCKSK